MNVRDLDQDRTVYRKRRSRTVHLIEDCPQLGEGAMPREAGQVLSDRPVCKYCSGERAKPPGHSGGLAEKLLAADPEEVTR